MPWSMSILFLNTVITRHPLLLRPKQEKKVTKIENCATLIVIAQGDGVSLFWPAYTIDAVYCKNHRKDYNT